MEFTREIIQGIAYFFFVNFPPGTYPIDTKMSPEQVFRASLDALAKEEISIEKCVQYCCESLEKFSQNSTSDLSLQSQAEIKTQLDKFKQEVLKTSELDNQEVNQLYLEFKAKFIQQLRNAWTQKMAKNFASSIFFDYFERVMWTIRFISGVEYFSDLQEKLPTDPYIDRLMHKILDALQALIEIENAQKAKSFLLQKEKERFFISKDVHRPGHLMKFPAKLSFKFVRQDLEKCVLVVRERLQQKTDKHEIFIETFNRIFSVKAAKL